MSVCEAVIALVGDPPPGYDIVVWVCCCMILIYLITSAFSIVASIINWIGGKS